MASIASPTITVSNIMDLLTDKSISYSQFSKISHEEHIAKMTVLNEKKNNIITVLSTNYWNKLVFWIYKAVRGNLASAALTPAKLLTKVRKYGFNNDISLTARESDLIYSYLVQLCVLIKYINITEGCVECTINYDDVDYDNLTV